MSYFSSFFYRFIRTKYHFLSIASKLISNLSVKSEYSLASSTWISEPGVGYHTDWLSQSK